MKQLKGFSTSVAIIVGVIMAIFIGATAFIISNDINSTHYENYDFNAYIAPDEHNGNIGDHIKGNPDAPVKIIEYADYQCPLCATVNPLIEEMLKDTDDLAIIFRYFVPAYHTNGTAAAEAAEAAGLQGYWEPYSEKLFKEQDNWGYVSVTKRTSLFKQYFEEVTEGKGDLEKFEQDLESEEIAQKVRFDINVAKRVDIPGTPAFFVDGNYIDWTNQEGAEITVNYRTITWNSTIKIEGLPGLLLKIAEAKLEPNDDDD